MKSIFRKYPVKEIVNFIITEKKIIIRIYNDNFFNKTNYDCNLCKIIYNSFISRHYKFPIIKRKTIGVALLEIPEKVDDYLIGSHMKYARRKINRAKRDGYQFLRFTPKEYIKDILEINESAPARQNKEMNSSYLSPISVLQFHEHGGENFGVFNENNKLVGYTVVPTCGEVCLLDRILGHNDHIENGIMFMLVQGVVNEICTYKKPGDKVYLFYDTWFGASEGLKYFKSHLGFKPYKVRWLFNCKEQI